MTSKRKEQITTLLKGIETGDAKSVEVLNPNQYIQHNPQTHEGRVGFEVFRFEGEKTVEHWDNIQSRKGPNPSGHRMVDGQTAIKDLAFTEKNRVLVKRFVSSVLIGRKLEQLHEYVSASYTEHKPRLPGGKRHSP